MTDPTATAPPILPEEAARLLRLATYASVSVALTLILATLIAVVCCLSLAFGAGGASGAGGLTIWPLFGSTNQILAGLTLLVLSVMLIKLGRPARYTLIPMAFVLVTSSWAAVLKLIEWYQAGNWLLVTIDLIVLITSVMVILEAVSVISRYRRDPAAPSEATKQ